MTTQQQKSVLLTRQHVAELLCVHPGTLERWSRLGIGPKPLKLSGTTRQSIVRYLESDVISFIEAKFEEAQQKAAM